MDRRGSLRPNLTAFSTTHSTAPSSRWKGYPPSAPSVTAWIALSQRATPFVEGDPLRTGRPPSHWATPFALGDSLRTGRPPSHWATPFALGYPLRTGLTPS